MVRINRFMTDGLLQVLQQICTEGDAVPAEIFACSVLSDVHVLVQYVLGPARLVQLAALTLPCAWLHLLCNTPPTWKLTEEYQSPQLQPFMQAVVGSTPQASAISADKLWDQASQSFGPAMPTVVAPGQQAPGIKLTSTFSDVATAAHECRAAQLLGEAGAQEPYAEAVLQYVLPMLPEAWGCGTSRIQAYPEHAVLHCM